MFAHHMCASVALGAALCALASTIADADEIRSIDEATFVAELRDRSPRLAASTARARAAAAAVDRAGVRPNPSLSWEREAVPGLDAHDDFVRLTVPIDLSGRRGLGIAAARAEAQAVAVEAARADLDVYVDGRRAYAAAAGARQRVGGLAAARSRLAELVDGLRARATAGDAAEYDAERVSLELELLDDELLTARRALASAQLALGARLGAPDTAIDAADDLRLPERHDAAASAPLRLIAAGHRARAMRLDAQQARRAWIPRLELGLGVVWSDNGVDRGLGYVVAVGGELPIFERGAAAARHATALAAAWDAEGAAVALEADAAIVATDRALAAAIEQAQRFAQGALDRATRLTRSAEVAYREGDRSIVELLDALRAERTTRTRALDLLLEVRDAELDRWLAQGRVP